MPILLWHLPLVIFLDRGTPPYRRARSEVLRRPSMPRCHLKRRNCRRSEVQQIEGPGRAVVTVISNRCVCSKR